MMERVKEKGIHPITKGVFSNLYRAITPYPQNLDPLLSPNMIVSSLTAFMENPYDFAKDGATCTEK